MGLTDDEFADLQLRYESGDTVPPKEKAAQIALIRQMECEVTAWWQWWLGWEYLSRGKTPAAKCLPAAKPPAQPGRLF